MRLRLLFAIALLVPVAVLAESSAFGQQTRERRTYNPGPVVTPYLDYLRVPTGPLDTYNQYVVPRTMLRNTLQQQQNEIAQQQRRLTTLRNDFRAEVEDFQNRPTQISGAAIRPTGMVGGYLNYSHYYPAGRR